MMDTQELFDRVAKHLLNQRQVSQNESGECLYRGPDGLRCAVGCLIDDKHYHEELEYETVCDPMVQEALENSLGSELTFQQIGLLDQLQLMHDTEDPSAWEDKLEKIAHRYGLRLNLKEETA